MVISMGPRQRALHAAAGTTAAESLGTGRRLHCWHAAVQHVPYSDGRYGSWGVPRCHEGYMCFSLFFDDVMRLDVDHMDDIPTPPPCFMGFSWISCEISEAEPPGGFGAREWRRSWFSAGARARKLGRPRPSQYRKHCGTFYTFCFFFFWRCHMQGKLGLSLRDKLPDMEVELDKSCACFCFLQFFSCMIQKDKHAFDN